MKTYSIQWQAWKDLKGCRKFMDARRANLKITNVLWLTTGWEVDPVMIDCVYTKHSPLLIWLN